MKKLMRFFKDEDGVTAVEYGIMVALVAMAIVVTVTSMGGSLNTLFTKVDAQLAKTPQ